MFQMVPTENNTWEIFITVFHRSQQAYSCIRHIHYAKKRFYFSSGFFGPAEKLFF